MFIARNVQCAARFKFLVGFFLMIFINELSAQQDYKKTGIASFYADKLEGRQTANGEIYYHAKKTAAHNNLPFGSIVKVTNLENGPLPEIREKIEELL